MTSANAEIFAFLARLSTDKDSDVTVALTLFINEHAWSECAIPFLGVYVKSCIEARAKQRKEAAGIRCASDDLRAAVSPVILSVKVNTDLTSTSESAAELKTMIRNKFLENSRDDFVLEVVGELVKDTGLQQAGVAVVKTAIRANISSENAAIIANAFRDETVCGQIAIGLVKDGFNEEVTMGQLVKNFGKNAVDGVCAGVLSAVFQVAIPVPFVGAAVGSIFWALIKTL